MFNKENWVGLLLVGLCGIVAIALLIEIFTDVRLEYSGPQWLARIITLGGTGLVLVMGFGALKRRFGRHGGPGAPRGGPSWPQNDLPRRTFSRTPISDAPISPETPPRDTQTSAEAEKQ